MNFVAVGVVLVAVYASERAAWLVGRMRLQKRRAKAEYPITSNDPVGRLIA